MNETGRNNTLRLLRTARGQVDGIIRMLEEGRYCIDISNQILATEALLKRQMRRCWSTTWILVSKRASRIRVIMNRSWKRSNS